MLPQQPITAWRKELLCSCLDRTMAMNRYDRHTHTCNRQLSGKSLGSCWLSWLCTSLCTKAIDMIKVTYATGTWAAAGFLGCAPVVCTKMNWLVTQLYTLTRYLSSCWLPCCALYICTTMNWLVTQLHTLTRYLSSFWIAWLRTCPWSYVWLTTWPCWTCSWLSRRYGQPLIGKNSDIVHLALQYQSSRCVTMLDMLWLSCRYGQPLNGNNNAFIPLALSCLSSR